MMRSGTLGSWILAFCLAGPALAQPAVTGTVLGPGNKPLAGARVELRPVLSDFEEGRRGLEAPGDLPPAAVAETDGAGRFSLKAPSAGMWKVAVHGTGMVPLQHGPLPLVDSIELPPAVLSAGRPSAGVWVAAGTGDLGPALQIPETTQGWQTVRVISRDGQPMPGIVARLAGNGRTLGQTDPQGRVRLPLSSGDVRVLWLTEDGRQAIQQIPTPDGDVTERTLTLGEPVVLTGRVLETGSRKPVPGAFVWRSTDPGAFVRADAEGRFRITAPGRRRFDLEVIAPGYLPRRSTIPGPQLTGGKGATLSLTRAARIQGKVVDPKGKPLPGATVGAVLEGALGERMFDPGDPVLDRAVTDAQGRFELRRLRPDTSYEVRASRAGTFSTAQRVTVSDPTATPRNVTLVLSPARAGRGKIQDPAGLPVAGAEVVVRPALRPSTSQTPAPAGQPVTEKDAISVQSDGQGVFLIPECPASEVELMARKKGFAPLSLPALRIPAGTGPADLGVVTLRPGARLAGHVIDQKNQAVPEAEVFALDGPTGVNTVDRHLKDRKPTVKTAADGRFVIEDLPKGVPAHLVVRAEGYLPARPGAIRPPTATPLVIRLEPEAVLQGRVMNEEEYPVAGARVTMRWQAFLPEDPERPLGEPVLKDTRTEPDGRFEIRGIPAGSVSFGVSAHGYVTLEDVKVELPQPPEAGELRLVLHRGAVLQGRVTTASGEPVPSARVAAGGAAATTDDDGAYFAEGVAPGPQNVLVLHPHQGRLKKPFDVQPGVNVLDFTYDPGYEVSGRVVDESGKPVTGARVELAAAVRYEGRQYQEVTGEGGRFRLSPVLDGRYRLNAEAEGFGETSVPGTLEVAGQPVSNLEITLERGAVLSGRILGLEPEDLTKVRVEARGEHGVEVAAWTDGRGRYEIRPLRPGDWVVRAAILEGQRQVQVRVPISRSDREITRDLEFNKRLTLSAQILYDEEPLPDAQFALHGQRLAAERTAVTDWEGRVRLDDLEPDTYRIALIHPAKMIVHNDQVELQADHEVVLRLQTSTVAGVVTSASSKPVSGALVSMRPLEGPEFLVTAGTKDDGHFGMYRVPPGRFRIEAQAEGFIRKEQEIQVTAGQALENLEIRLAPAQGTKIRLRLASGQTPKLVHLQVRDPAGTVQLSETRLTDASGIAELTKLPPGAWQILVRAEEGAVTTASLLVPSEILTVTLPTAGKLSVRVSGLVTSDLIGTLRLLGPDQQPFWTLGPGGQIQQQWEVMGGKGSIAGVPAGTWTVQVETPDGQKWTGTATTSGIGEAALTIE